MELVAAGAREAVDISALPHLTHHDLDYKCAFCTKLNKAYIQGQLEWKEADAENGCSYCELRLLAIRNVSGPKGILQGRNIGCIHIEYNRRHKIYIKEDNPKYMDGRYMAILELIVVAQKAPNLWPVRASGDFSLPRADAYVSVVSQWLRNCLETHKDCSVSGSNLPSRVLDVGINTSPGLRLHVSKREKAAYFALSHCWGKAVVTTTTRENFLQRQAGIDFNEIPKTFQDAVTVTRDLGVRYLWIDSLCIIQNDKADWQTESGNMASIYSNAALVIGADMSKDCHGGFLKRENTDNGSLQPVAIATIQNNAGAKCVVYAWKERLHGQRRLYQKEPLAERAWALQENILASRMVHFTEEELIWECRRTIHCECRELEYIIYRGKSQCRSLFHQILSSKPSKAHFSDLWEELVKEHCLRDITYEMDLLPCMSGIASQMQAHGAGEYLAGLWKNQLPKSLLWAYKPYLSSNLLLETRKRFWPYRAPTWSWASVSFLRRRDAINLYDGTIGFGGPFWHSYERLESRVRIIEAHCTPTGNDALGAVSDGYIKLSGLLVLVRLCKRENSTEMVLKPRKERYRDCYATTAPDIELPTTDSNPMYCVLLATDSSTDPHLHWTIGTGLILRASKQHENCFERIGLFKTYGKKVKEVMRFFRDAKKTTITIV